MKTSKILTLIIFFLESVTIDDNNFIKEIESLQDIGRSIGAILKNIN
jgi:hypothetical protein